MAWHGPVPVPVPVRSGRVRNTPSRVASPAAESSVPVSECGQRGVSPRVPRPALRRVSPSRRPSASAHRRLIEKTRRIKFCSEKIKRVAWRRACTHAVPRALPTAHGCTRHDRTRVRPRPAPGLAPRVPRRSRGGLTRFAWRTASSPVHTGAPVDRQSSRVQLKAPTSQQVRARRSHGTPRACRPQSPAPVRLAWDVAAGRPPPCGPRDGGPPTRLAIVHPTRWLDLRITPARAPLPPRRRHLPPSAIATRAAPARRPPPPGASG